MSIKGLNNGKIKRLDAEKIETLQLKGPDSENYVIASFSLSYVAQGSLREISSPVKQLESELSSLIKNEKKITKYFLEHIMIRHSQTKKTYEIENVAIKIID